MDIHGKLGNGRTICEEELLPPVKAKDAYTGAPLK